MIAGVDNLLSIVQGLGTFFRSLADGLNKLDPRRDGARAGAAGGNASPLSESTRTMVDALQSNAAATEQLNAQLAALRGQAPASAASATTTTAGTLNVTAGTVNVQGPAQPSGTSAGSAGPAPSSAPSANPAAIGGAMKTVAGTIGQVVGALKTMTQASGVAFAGIAGGMVGLASAASPAAFQTLTQSAQLLAATIGGALLEPIIKVAFRLQDLAAWFRALDPSIKQTIGAVAAWSLAITGGAVAIGKIGGVVQGVLPLFAALRTAMVFATANPFGGVLAGLAAIAATSPHALTGLAEMGKSVAGAVGALTTALGSLGHAFGATNVQTLQFLAGTALLFPIAKQVATALFALSAAAVQAGHGSLIAAAGSYAAAAAKGVWAAATGAVNGVLAVLRAMCIGAATGAGMAAAGALAAAAAKGAWAVATKLAALALHGLKIAIAGTGIGLLAIGLAAATSALLSFGGAFGTVGTQIETARQTIKKLDDELRRLREGGKVTDKELMLTEDEEAALRRAKTPEERQEVFKKAKEDAEEWADYYRKKEGAVGKALEAPVQDPGRSKAGKQASEILADRPDDEPIGKNSGLGVIVTEHKRRAIARLHQMRQNLIDSGVSKETAYRVVMGMYNDKESWDIIGKENVTPAEVDRIKDRFGKDAKEQEVKAAQLDIVLKQGGIDPATGKAPTTRLEALQGLQARHAVAFGKEDNATFMAIDQARKHFQVQALNQNPIEQQILEVQRENNRILQNLVLKELQEINRRFPLR